MHGRLKVKTSEEQAKARHLERLAKLKVYNAATERIFSKRAAGECDREALELTGKVLAKNPDFYTLWNYRKEVYQTMAKSLSPDELNDMMKNELDFLQECLMVNPKSYGTWEQRCFTMNLMPHPDWKKELSLCNLFLSYDERNFHCWDYRRFVTKKACVPHEDELQFTTEKIASNFSNYSSWHQRSKLLPLIFPSPDTKHSSGLAQETLLQEMELVQNAFFTDPNDQSAWFYHRWLLGRVQNPLQLLDVFQSPDDRLVLTFSSSVKVVEDADDHFWFNPTDSGFSNVWFTSLSKSPSKVQVHSGSNTYTFDVADQHETLDKPACSYFRHEVTAATAEVLEQELDSCQQLFDLEPDNKWVLLTIALLMHSIDPDRYSDKILANFDKLMLVDKYRQRYYQDLRSRFIWEQAISNLQGVTLTLSDQKLTRLDNPQLLYNITSLDVSHNLLVSLNGVSCMQRLKSLDASNNQLKDCLDIQYLSILEKVDLSNNKKLKEESVEKMKLTCKSLKTIVID